MDAKGRHMGGRILPGLQMMRDALLKGTAGIDQTDGEDIAFADNTADAVSSGTLHMLQAGLIEICSSAARLLGNNMKIIITGGMSEQIMSLHGLPELVHEPDLVMLGLRVAAETTLAGN
jgi:type III pantothenate kinase